MIVPALQIANKIPDVYLQLWASSLLKGWYHSRFIQDFDFLIFFCQGVILCIFKK